MKVDVVPGRLLCYFLVSCSFTHQTNSCVLPPVNSCLVYLLCFQSFIKCKHIDYMSSRTESFYDIQINIKGKKDSKLAFRFIHAVYRVLICFQSLVVTQHVEMKRCVFPVNFFLSGLYILIIRTLNRRICIGMP